MPAALSATGLHKTYGKATALAGVDLQVEAGELVGLLGPNGAGKSTLVKIACGLVRPSGGAIEILGAPREPAAVALGGLLRAVGGDRRPRRFRAPRPVTVLRSRRDAR